VKCSRCGKSNPGASWYCSKCGASLADLNVADSVGRRQLPPLLRWSLLASGVLLLFVVVFGLASIGFRDRPPREGDASEAGASEPTIVSRAPATPTPRIVTPVPTPLRRPGVAPWLAPRLTVAPRIDGYLNEWAGVPIVVDAVVFGDEDWSGPEDASGRAFAGWDDRALYLGVQVIDDVFSQPSTGQQLFLGDSLDVQIDADLAGDWAADAYNGDDWQIGLSPGNFDNHPPEAYLWRPVTSPATAIEIAARRLESGYILEAAIPWPLVGFDPARMRGIGIALNISDNDESAAAQMSMVSSSPLRSWADPRTFGTLILGDPLPE
jgi:hypothetical protein